VASATPWRAAPFDPVLSVFPHATDADTVADLLPIRQVERLRMESLRLR